MEIFDSESKSLSGGEEAKNVLQTVPIDREKNVLQTVPIDQALIPTGMSVIENIPIFSDVSDNRIGWSSGSQEKRNTLSTTSMNMIIKMDMNMNKITNCSNQTGLRRIGHVLESISSDIMEIEEDCLSSFSRDLTSSGIRSIASAPSTFSPSTADSLAASLNVSANVLGARDEYGVGSRRSPATFTSPLANQPNNNNNNSNNNNNDNYNNNNNDNDNSTFNKNKYNNKNKDNNNNYNTEPKPKHTGTSPSAVISSEIDLVNRENCTSGNPRQLSSNHSSITFEIFKHPDDVVWGLDSRSEPPDAVSRLVCGIIEREVHAPEGHTICASTQGASSAHDRSIKYDEGSDSQDVLTFSHSVQSTDPARTLVFPLSLSPALVPVSYPCYMPDTLPAHVPVDLPGDDENRLQSCALDSMTTIVTQLKDDTVRGSDNKILIVGETRRDGDTIIAVCGEPEGKTSDTIDGKEKECRTSSFVPRTRSKVRCSAPTYQATSSPSRTYLEEEKVLSGIHKACSATDGINAWIEESCEREIEEDGEQEETVLGAVGITLSHDVNRKSSTAPASIHTHSHRGVYSVLSVLLVNSLPNSQFSTMSFTTLHPSLPPFLRLLLFVSMSISLCMLTFLHK